MQLNWSVRKWRATFLYLIGKRHLPFFVWEFYINQKKYKKVNEARIDKILFIVASFFRIIRKNNSATNQSQLQTTICNQKSCASS